MLHKYVLRLAIAGSVAALTASLLGAPAQATAAPTAPATATATPDQVEAPVPDIDWKKCEWAKKLDCAKVKVPLDYDKLDGKKIRLGILRDPANEPKKRIGSVFVNPGGPGGSATDFAASVRGMLGKQVQQRFDIVGIDPRGVGLTENAVCKGPRGKHPQYPGAAFPLGRKQENRWLKADASNRAFCAKHHNAVFDHVSTADTARDMDLIRQSLGDEQLTYYGISYGSYLGQTYAAMFPDRVRALIIDGVLDPVAWSAGRGDSAKHMGFSTRLRSGHGAYEALVSGLAECDRVGVKRCPAAGDAYGKWRTIVRKARNDKLVVGGERVDYSFLVGDALGSLYSSYAYRSLMRYINALYQKSTNKPGSRVSERADKVAVRTGDHLREIWRDRQRSGLYGAQPSSSYAQINDSFSAVACSDSDNPKNPKAWIKASKRDDYTMPWFGRLWTWSSSICSNWPGSSADAYKGPWNNIATSTPLLVIGNAHDPATPISGARAANRAFNGSQLLMLDGWGHGALGVSNCVKDRMESYLVRQILPPSGVVCKANRALYPARK